MHPRTHSLRACLVALAMGPGCYSGLSGGSAHGEADEVGSGAGSDDAADDEGGSDDDGAGVDACAAPELGATPLTRLTRAEYGVDHPRKVGGGITESLLSVELDYASASSGSALSKTTHHQRNLVMVHPHDGREGYFVLFDDLDGLGDSFASSLHPVAVEASTRTENADYDFTIVRPAVDGPVDTAVSLRVFYGTTPQSVELRDGAMCAFDGKSFASKYLHATYPTTPNGPSMVTVLFPHDETHADAELQRIENTVATGATIDLGDGIVDTAVSSSGAELVALGEVSLQATAAMFRSGDSGVAYYFERAGIAFDDGAEPRTGFSSTLPVSLHVRGDEGRITSATASMVTFYAPGLGSVTVDPGADEVVTEATSIGEVTVALDVGTHVLAFGMAGASDESGTGGVDDGSDGGGSASTNASTSGAADDTPGCTAPGDGCVGTGSDDAGAAAGDDAGCGCVAGTDARARWATLLGFAAVVLRSRRRRARR